MSNYWRKLFNSTHALHRRFRGNQRVTIPMAYRVLSEERAELDCELVLKGDRQALLEEAIDNIVTLFGLGIVCGLDMYTFDPKEEMQAESLKGAYYFLARARLLLDWDLTQGYERLVIFSIGEEFKAILDLLRMKGFYPKDIEKMIDYVIEKNDAKSKETHFLREDGKIARLG